MGKRTSTSTSRKLGRQPHLIYSYVYSYVFSYVYSYVYIYVYIYV